jgi:hypothetical protein
MQRSLCCIYLGQTRTTEDTKMEYGRYHTARGPVIGTEITTAEFSPWKPTIAGVREAALEYRITGTSFSDGELGKFAPSQREVEHAAQMTREAVLAGRVIDLGYWPNEFIKAAGMRGGPLYAKGGIGHPFRDPWVLFHSWSGSADSVGTDSVASSAYVVNLLDREKPAGGDFEILELEAIRARDRNVLMIGDRALFSVADTTDDKMSYNSLVFPSVWRRIYDQINHGIGAERAAAANLADPLMTALLILNTRGVPRETIKADTKLNKARSKNGKPPIPPYEFVYSKEYVTALMSRGKGRRGDPQGGTHASPVPHLRMGHSRTYASGAMSFIQDTMVRVSPEARAAFKAQRSHYQFRP